MSSKQARIDQIREEIENLTDSPLYEYRTENRFKPVIGAGSLDAKVVFVGEAPGEQEARTGRPFVGASGRVLDELLASINLSRDDIYITNIVNDRPPKNRDPRVGELKLYSPFLVRQLDIIQPQVIATLGRFAMDFILKLYDAPQAGETITQLHGKPLAVSTGYGPATLLPLYHPAVSLYNDAQRPVLDADFLALRELLK